jgi:hypothetical protein
MKATKVLLVILVAISAVVLTIRACKSTVDLKQRIKQNEEELKNIDSTRAKNNAMPIPFKSDVVRDSVMESVNKKNGFGLHLRKPKGD